MILKHEAIEQALRQSYRQYLCGDLKRSQALQEIPDQETEVGISVYDHFAADIPHAHSISTEYCYILEGMVKVLLLATNQEFLLEQGDFHRLLPGTFYATKNAPGTKVLFIKSHCGNDKVLAEGLDAQVQDWLQAW